MRKTRGLLLAATVLAAGGFALAACGSAGAGTGTAQSATSVAATAVIATAAPTPATATPTGPAPTSTGPGRTVTATDADNGRTITVATGDRLTVRLDTTFWAFATDTLGPALREVGVPAYAAVPPGGGRCVPGGGCGSASAQFEAVSPGTGVVIATRRVCGEAMNCTAGRGVYRLVVIVR